MVVGTVTSSTKRDHQGGQLPIVVGIGSSAGGLKSLQLFFEHLATNHDASFVVVQHMSPDANSSLAEILSRFTDLSVEVITSKTKLTPGSIYVIPPGKEIRLDGHHFVVSALDRKQMSRPIDTFFRSLAENFQAQAIGIVLSGTGSDGADGVREIHSVNGRTVVESPDSAQFDGMPKNAISTDCVDFVMRPDEIARWLSLQLENPRQRTAPVDQIETEDLSGVQLIFSLLSNSYDIDFGHYKPSTVARRIERRQLMCRQKSIEDYAEYLSKTPDEIGRLYYDLLIGVTKFFRDRDAFDNLQKVIDQRLRNWKDGDCFRVWVAGCATGEESYSIAMLLHESFRKLGLTPNLKIFSTDVHSEALKRAARAVYSAKSLEFVDVDRRNKFFTEGQDGSYRICSEIRRSLVFARHNVIKDAPFTKLDLVTCRNLLIYFQPEAQSRAISSFHFSLRKNGIMMLGASEGPGSLSEEFAALDETWKIYNKLRNLPNVINSGEEFRIPYSERPRRLVNILNRDQPESLSFTALLEGYDLILRDFVKSGLLIDQNKNILHVFGDASRFLKSRAGRFSGNLINFLDGDTKIAIAAGLIRATSNPNESILLESVQLSVGEQLEVVDVRIKLLANSSHSAAMWFLEFASNQGPETEVHERVLKVDRSNDAYTRLESELMYTRENLCATIEELETSNEELQAANEELLAANEELQSTNEELHSVNEELYSVNAENQRRIESLEEMTDDVDNLLDSTDIGTIFLDSELRVRKFSHAAAKYVKLLSSDIGRDISDFATHLQLPTLFEHIQQVIKDGEPFSQEVKEAGGKTILVRILPYMSGKKIKGGIVNFIELAVKKDT